MEVEVECSRGKSQRTEADELWNLSAAGRSSTLGRPPQTRVTPVEVLVDVLMA